MLTRLHGGPTLLLASILLAACGGGATPDAADCSHTADALHPDVVGATAEPTGEGSWRFAATLCSAYDTPGRHADAWRVRTESGQVLAVRELAHDHASEQPFTRSLAAPVLVPEGVTRVVVDGRDQTNGWGGDSFVVDLTG